MLKPRLIQQINLGFRSFYVCKIFTGVVSNIGFDLIGPLPETPLGNKYICTVTDYYTKWADATALPSKQAKLNQCR